MEKLKVLAVERDLSFAETIKEMFESLDYGPVKFVDNELEAIDAISEEDHDLVLLDVPLDGSGGGLALARKLTNVKPLPIVFLTTLADQESFQKAKEAFPYGFVNKPFDERTLKYAMELAINNFGFRVKQLEGPKPKPTPTHKNFFVKVGNRLINLEVTKIRWIEVQSDYCSISTDEKRYHVKISLKAFLEKLPPSDFIQIHRRYVININYITHIDTQNFVAGLEDDQVPIGRTYRDDLIGRIDLL